MKAVYRGAAVESRVLSGVAACPLGGIILMFLHERIVQKHRKVKQ